MSLINGNALQIGNSGTATQNATLIANGDGTFTLARGNVGATTQDLLTIDASGVVSIPQKNLIKSGSVIATTSGTAHDFTGIPSWVKRITLMLDNVSTNGTSFLLVQIGDSGGIATSGYSGSQGNRVSEAAFSVGFTLLISMAATALYSGCITLSLLDSGSWVENSIVSDDAGSAPNFSAGSKTLSATLDRIRLTTVNGTDLFDAGKINILYEG